MAKLPGIAVAASLLMSSAGSASQPPVQTPPTIPLNHLAVLKGGYFPLQSKEARHLYHIYVRLPLDYASERRTRYPVVYLLDGDAFFPWLSAQHLYMTIDEKLDEAILVGIAYGSFDKPTNRRQIDFTPPGRDVKPEDSGAESFHRFLDRELIPTIETRYRADPQRRILFGQSRSGAMILYSAFTRPDRFWARVASNPSWVPGREIFYGDPRPTSRSDLHLFVALGTEEHADRRAAAAEWFGHWHGRTTPWSVTRIDIPGGTHSADAGNAYRAAMRRLFGIPAPQP
ncbi:MAG TPA: alpha/beta hydrolase-fold protein [Sphingomicrobium sp.]|nr:alpha/beta hydrolase-fold protein [Sphingomicrobium sp.]